MNETTPEERAQRVFDNLCEDPQVWATHGMPQTGKEILIVASIADAIREGALAMTETTASVPIEPTDAMIDAGLSVTATWLDIPGSGLTIAREKMRRRYKAMVSEWTRHHEQTASEE